MPEGKLWKGTVTLGVGRKKKGETGKRKCTPVRCKLNYGGLQGLNYTLA